MWPNENVKIYEIFEIVEELNNFLSQNYERIYVIGEISKIQTYSSGHTYLTLKDERGYVLNGVLFKWYAKSNKKTLESIKKGNKVIAMGRLNVYRTSGNLQIIIMHFEQVEGSGVWLKKFNEIKERMEKKGYTDIKYKKSLPKIIKGVGIITSIDGAAIKDIFSVYKKRKSDIKVYIYPSLVQGEKAAETLIRGIEFFNRHYKDKIDIIILTRGGGSIEDLWCFNDEKLAEAIFKSELPIISAVGHERDISISDYVADIRVATPTAAGELVFKDNSEKVKQMYIRLYHYYQWFIRAFYEKKQKINQFLQGFERFIMNMNMVAQDIDHKRMQLINSMENKFSYNNNMFMVKKNKFYKIFSPEKVKYYKQMLESKNTRLYELIYHRLNEEKQQIKHNIEHLNRVIEYKLTLTNRRIEKKKELLNSLSPFNILRRGYSILLKENKTVKSYKDVKQGDLLKAIIYNGELDLEVKNGRKKEV